MRKNRLMQESKMVNIKKKSNDHTTLLCGFKKLLLIFSQQGVNEFLMKTIKKITYIDLFAGAGGLSEGFACVGYDPIAHVEMSKGCAL